MEASIKKISEEFSRGNTAFAEQYLHGDATWLLIGDKEVRGKATIIQACQVAENIGFLPFENKLTITERQTVAVKGNSINNESFYCDIYQFENGLIHKITSYFIQSTKHS